MEKNIKNKKNMKEIYRIGDSNAKTGVRNSFGNSRGMSKTTAFK